MSPICFQDFQICTSKQGTQVLYNWLLCVLWLLMVPEHRQLQWTKVILWSSVLVIFLGFPQLSPLAIGSLPCQWRPGPRRNEPEWWRLVGLEERKPDHSHHTSWVTMKLTTSHNRWGVDKGGLVQIGSNFQEVLSKAWGWCCYTHLEASSKWMHPNSKWKDDILQGTEGWNMFQLSPLVKLCESCGETLKLPTFYYATSMPKNAFDDSQVESLQNADVSRM